MDIIITPSARVPHSRSHLGKNLTALNTQVGPGQGSPAIPYESCVSQPSAFAAERFLGPIRGGRLPSQKQRPLVEWHLRVLGSCLVLANTMVIVGNVKPLVDFMIHSKAADRCTVTAPMLLKYCKCRACVHVCANADDDTKCTSFLV